MGWKCMMCKKQVDIDIRKVGMTCPYCNGKVFYKDRPTTAKRIKSI